MVPVGYVVDVAQVSVVSEELYTLVALPVLDIVGVAGFCINWAYNVESAVLKNCLLALVQPLTEATTDLSAFITLLPPDAAVYHPVNV